MKPLEARRTVGGTSPRRGDLLPASMTLGQVPDPQTPVPSTFDGGSGGTER